jgi:uncharacterized ferritin-like protein (DUF455 family)
MPRTPIESYDGAPPLARAAGTVEAWCRDFVVGRVLGAKLAPPEPPDPEAYTSWEKVPQPCRLTAPGRPSELRVIVRAPRTVGASALRQVPVRACLLHTFLHHELQAAELFAWAILAFPETPRTFRAGLLALCREELRHLSLYARHLAELGFQVGAFPVRDWFWERVPLCRTPAAFVALQGLGLEGANLEHTARFATLFRSAGDAAGAVILERIGRDEVAHVAFAKTWFERFTEEPLDYDAWRQALPAPLTPAMLRGVPLHREARRRAGFDAAFLSRLESEPPATEPSPR